MVSFNTNLGSGVIDSFINFMSGCGFSKEFAMSYMEEIVEEYRDTQKALVKIKEILIILI
jgi:hypothetical protein